MATMTIWTTVAGMKENISTGREAHADVRTSNYLIPNQDQPNSASQLQTDPESTVQLEAHATFRDLR